MSTETAYAALPNSIPHAPPERTSEPAMGDMHNIDPFFPPLGTPARLNAEASLARSPPDCIDGTPSNALPSGAEAERPQRVLRDALVAASCRSNPGGELVPPMMSPLHQSRRSPEMAATEPLEHDDDDDNTEHTMVELTKFINELTDARAQNDFLKAHVTDLTRQLDDNAVGAAYVCHICPILRDDLCKYQQSLDEAANLLLHEKTLRSERELELERLRSYCRQVERAHDETKQMLVATQSKAAARPVPRYAPPAVPGSPSPAHPPFNLSLPHTTAPASAVPVRPSAVSPFPHHLAPNTGGQASAVYLSARELNATIAAAPVALEVASGPSRGIIARDALPGIEPASRCVPWVVQDLPDDAIVLPAPVLSVTKLSTTTLKTNLVHERWRPGAKFFLNQLTKMKGLRDELDQHNLWFMISALAKGNLRIVIGDGPVDPSKRAALVDMCTRAQQPYSGISQYSPLLYVLSEYPQSDQVVYMTYDALIKTETILTDLLRRAASVELQREIFQQGASSSYSALAKCSFLPFGPQFDHGAYREEVYTALSLKYATRHFPNFDAWLYQLCMHLAFFNTAFSNSECCAAADFIDRIHRELGTNQLTRASIDQFFKRGPDKRLQLIGLTEEAEYCKRIEEFLPGMSLSETGNTIPVAYVHSAGNPRLPRHSAGGAASGRQSTAAESIDSGGCRQCNRDHDECKVCQYCLRCDHDETHCPHVGVAAADATPMYPRYFCPRCLMPAQQEGSHWAVHCKKLPEDLLHRRFYNKSLREVQAMAHKPAKGRSKSNGKSDVASFGRMVDGTLQRFFKKVGKDAVKNPQLRSQVVGHIMATLGQTSNDPSARKTSAATVTATKTQDEIDTEYIRALEREFKKQQLEADQSRARK